jgi:hypothetical protein
MKLSDVFEHLQHGELSHIFLGTQSVDDTTSGIDPKEYPRLVSSVNQALTALYTRFWLASQDVIIQQYDHIQQYWLDSKYSWRNALSTERTKYLMDSEFEPFLDNCLKIEQVYDEDGRGLFLNDLTEPWSVFTPTYNSIQVPYPMWCNHLLVHYRANHPKIHYNKDHFDPAQIELQIPEGFLEPLLYYVASRIFAGMDVDGGQGSMQYLQKYEQSCKMLESRGLQITPHYGNTRLDDHGWV